MLYAELDVNIAVYGETTKETVKSNLKMSERTLNTLTYESSSRVKLAAGASDVAVNFQSVTNGQLIVLKADAEFTVKINGAGNPALTLKPQINTDTNAVTPAFLAMLANGVTSLHLGNPGTAVLAVDVGISGQG